MSEQEISIKAREHELYVRPLPETDGKPVKPFEVYLKQTPAVPFSPTTRGILAIVSIIVGLLFLGALWRATTHHFHEPPARTKKVRPTAKAAPPRPPSASPIHVSSASARGRGQASGTTVH